MTGRMEIETRLLVNPLVDILSEPAILTVGVFFIHECLHVSRVLKIELETVRKKSYG